MDALINAELVKFYTFSFYYIAYIVVKYII